MAKMFLLPSGDWINLDHVSRILKCKADPEGDIKPSVYLEMLSSGLSGGRLLIHCKTDEEMDDIVRRMVEASGSSYGGPFH